jgi:hypothetical protein
MRVEADYATAAITFVTVIGYQLQSRLPPRQADRP